jgi:putative protein-disulfide isomerase
MKLIYAGDPMCSWCYGFGKEISALAKRHPELPLQIMVGGLRAGATDLLDDEGKQFRMPHWARVEALSGMPLNRSAFLARENFVYDTEPVCRAVVTARRVAPAADQLAVFRALQHAFYVDGLDTTDGAVLAQVAASALDLQGYAVTAPAFHEAWSNPATIEATSTEIAQVRAMGVSSFPTLILQVDQKLIKIGPGYAHVDQLDAQLSAILSQPRLAA